MGSKYDLTDKQWVVVELLIPKRKPRLGCPCADDRRTLNGILDVLKTGCAWQDLPAEYGSPTTCWRRLSPWFVDGTREAVWRSLLSQLDTQGKLEWVQAFLDGSFVPANRGALEAARQKLARAAR